MYFSFKLNPLRYLYNVLTLIASFHLNAASLFHKKIALGVKGRQQTATILSSKISRNDKTIWFHCASLGEYEQGLPPPEQSGHAPPISELFLKKKRLEQGPACKSVLLANTGIGKNLGSG